MLKTVKHGSGIREDPPPCFFKIPTFSRFFLGGASLSEHGEITISASEHVTAE